MTKAPLVLLAAALIGSSVPAYAQTLTLMGTNAFTVDGGSTTAGYSQTATNLTFSSAFGLGATLGGLFTTTNNWSSAAGFGLLMSVAGSDPQASFTIELYDSTVFIDPLLAVIATYSGDTAGISGTPAILPLNLVSTGTGAFSDVVGMQFTWDAPAAGGSGAVTIASIEAVPEPTTWAMLALGAILFGGLALRRRLAAVRR